MLRAVVVLLLLANGLFFAWSQGWLAPWIPPRADPREPERLTSQVRPELITVMSPKAASDAVATAASAASAPGGSAPESDPPLLCLEAGPFSDAAVAAAEGALSLNGVPDGAVRRDAVAVTFTWGVVMGRFADRETQRAKAEELKKLGVRSDEINSPPALAPGLRLGNYSDRYGAESALGNLAKKGVRTARVSPLPTGPLQHWLRADKADAELQTRLKSLPGDKLGGGFKPCTPKTGRL